MPEFFAYGTYWAIVTVALACCAVLGYVLGGWLGAVIGGGIYLAHEVIVVFYAWRPATPSLGRSSRPSEAREQVDNGK